MPSDFPSNRSGSQRLFEGPDRIEFVVTGELSHDALVPLIMPHIRALKAIGEAFTRRFLRERGEFTVEDIHVHDRRETGENLTLRCGFETHENTTENWDYRYVLFGLRMEILQGVLDVKNTRCLNFTIGVF